MKCSGYQRFTRSAQVVRYKVGIGPNFLAENDIGFSFGERNEVSTLSIVMAPHTMRKDRHYAFLLSKVPFQLGVGLGKRTAAHQHASLVRAFADPKRKQHHQQIFVPRDVDSAFFRQMAIVPVKFNHSRFVGVELTLPNLLEKARELAPLCAFRPAEHQQIQHYQREAKKRKQEADHIV